MTDPGRDMPPPLEPLHGACPHCGWAVTTGDPFNADTLECPVCHGFFTADAAARAAADEPEDNGPDHDEPDHDEPGHDGDDDRADELDGLRIRQLSALRRGAIRARSFALIGVVASLVTAIQLGLKTFAEVRARGWGPWPTGFVLFAAVALMLAGCFARRAGELQRELRTPAPLPPVPPGGPDLSTLSDGSQQWKNLDEIQ